ncbi:hypothetical protein [Streptomyces sp. NPDC021224]|uniref:hypothetical protein n=1 Tax=unclassified Streptomyces TaxID=2593676 RepID=UPI0037A4B3F4
MPNVEGTPRRTVRVADEDWADLALRAPLGDRAAVIKALVAWYLRRPGARLPERPPVTPEPPQG